MKKSLILLIDSVALFAICAVLFMSQIAMANTDSCGFDDRCEQACYCDNDHQSDGCRNGCSSCCGSYCCGKQQTCSSSDGSDPNATCKDRKQFPVWASVVLTILFCGACVGAVGFCAYQCFRTKVTPISTYQVPGTAVPVNGSYVYQQMPNGAQHGPSGYTGTVATYGPPNAYQPAAVVAHAVPVYDNYGSYNTPPLAVATIVSNPHAHY